MYRHGPHVGEEPPLSGRRGSGAVFFSRCPLRCLYCQNHPWSQGGQGSYVTDEDLSAALRDLARQGCHNWNLVSPTPWLPWIRRALRRTRELGVALPVVYNTSGYERIETVAEWAEDVAVWLTNLRYARPETAAQASGAADYVEVARRALTEMWRLRGPLRLNEEGVAESGVICRLLILPGHAEEAVANLRWLAETVGTGISVSLMSQYLPLNRAARIEGWNRRITRREYERVRDEALNLGFSEGWFQEPDEMPAEDLVGERMRPGGGEAVGVVQAWPNPAEPAAAMKEGSRA